MRGKYIQNRASEQITRSVRRWFPRNPGQCHVMRSSSRNLHSTNQEAYGYLNHLLILYGQQNVGKHPKERLSLDTQSGHQCLATKNVLDGTYGTQAGCGVA